MSVQRRAFGNLKNTINSTTPSLDVQKNSLLAEKNVKEEYCNDSVKYDLFATPQASKKTPIFERKNYTASKLAYESVSSDSKLSMLKHSGLGQKSDGYCPSLTSMAKQRFTVQEEEQIERSSYLSLKDTYEDIRSSRIIAFEVLGEEKDELLFENNDEKYETENIFQTIVSPYRT